MLEANFKFQVFRRIVVVGMGSSATALSSASVPLAAVIDDTHVRPTQKSVAPAASASSRGGGKALKLGLKTADEDQFLKQLKSEGLLHKFVRTNENKFFVSFFQDL